jgi:hypothetical protein
MDGAPSGTGAGAARLGAAACRSGGHQQEECVQFTKFRKAALIGAALASLSPVAAVAAEVETTRTTTTQQNQGRQDNDIPWGLAGLAGLLGLLGLRKKERDIHVDARRHDDTTTRRP